VDIEGFSVLWEKDQVLWSLGELMRAIFRLARHCYPREPDRLTMASTMAPASVIGFTISMNGFLDTPPNASTAVGGGIALFDTAADMISVSVFFAGLSSPATESHIHLGGPGVPGGVLVSFVPVHAGRDQRLHRGRPVGISDCPDQ
jgi:hypothetical protein